MSHSQNGYHQKGYKQQTANAAVVVEKREPSCAGSENVNWYSHYGEKYGSFLKKLKIELPWDPSIPFLGIYLDKSIIWSCMHPNIGEGNGNPLQYSCLENPMGGGAW